VDILNIVEHIFDTVEISLDLCSRSPIVLPVVLKDFMPDAVGTHLVERRLYEGLPFDAISDQILFPLRDVLPSDWRPWRGRRRRRRRRRVGPRAATSLTIAKRPLRHLATTNCGGTPRLLGTIGHRARRVGPTPGREWKLTIPSSSTAGQRWGSRGWAFHCIASLTISAIRAIIAVEDPAGPFLIAAPVVCPGASVTL